MYSVGVVCAMYSVGVVCAMYSVGVVCAMYSVGVAFSWHSTNPRQRNKRQRTNAKAPQVVSHIFIAVQMHIDYVNTVPHADRHL